MNRIIKNIDFPSNNECAFITCCRHGYLDNAKLLLLMHPDIDITKYDNDAFICACYDGHLNVALWLQSLKPYLYVVKGLRTCKGDQSKYGKIKYYIRTKEEQEEEKKWENIKYGLWLQINTNNIINILPNDISKNILSYV